MLRHYMKCRGELEDWDEHMPGPDIIARYSKTSNRWYIGLDCGDTQTATVMSWLRSLLGSSRPSERVCIIGEYPEHFSYYCNKFLLSRPRISEFEFEMYEIYSREKYVLWPGGRLPFISLSVPRSYERITHCLAPGFQFLIKGATGGENKNDPTSLNFYQIIKGNSP